MDVPLRAPLTFKGHDVSEATSIEDGYFIFTLMPSLKCSLNCPHCYLSKEQRRDPFVMPVEQLREIAKKVNSYWNEAGLKARKVVCYWYGGEPTEMGLPYMESAFEALAEALPESDGNSVTHTVLTSLLTVEKEWFDFFERKCSGYFQSSFDGLMRGKGYVRKWEEKIKEALSHNLSIATISVVNHEMLMVGPEAIIDYLGELGIIEASFLPFMLNAQNESHAYGKFAPTMDAWSDFMMKATERWEWRKSQGLKVPEIGQTRFVLEQNQRPFGTNNAAQTLFLMPNGDFSLPDYHPDSWKEYLRPFGNANRQTFAEILASKERRDYLRKQILKNGNPECLTCEVSNSCMMEFWKKNRPGDDCFGGKRFVTWLSSHEKASKWGSSDTVLF